VEPNSTRRETMGLIAEIVLFIIIAKLWYDEMGYALPPDYFIACGVFLSIAITWFVVWRMRCYARREYAHSS
jgi:protein-S-isoprenylcysteine O-methyltransferase Ste14